MSHVLQERVLDALLALHVDRLTATFYGGAGCILMFHRVVEGNESKPRLHNDAIEVSVDYLDRIVRHFAESHDFVALDEISARLSAPGRRPFLCVTFDDGYRDNFTLAYPLLKRLGVPFAIYICTSFPDHKAMLWPYALEDVVRDRASVTLRYRGQSRTWAASMHEEKLAAFEQIWDIIFNAPEEEWPAFWTSFFGAYDVDVSAYAQRMAMNWADVSALAADPLVTLGAHTIRHLPLARLADADARREIVESGRILAARIGRPVRHFSYPFGSTGAASAREFGLAREAGYATAVTTRRGNVFPRHLEHLHALPRIDTGRTRADLAFLRSQVSGLRAFLKRDFRTFVTE